MGRAGADPPGLYTQGKPEHSQHPFRGATHTNRCCHKCINLVEGLHVCYIKGHADLDMKNMSGIVANFVPSLGHIAAIRAMLCDEVWTAWGDS